MALYDILSVTDSPVLIANTSAEILQANRALLEAFGYTGEELVGQKLHLLLPIELRQRHEAHFSGFVESAEQERRMGQRGEVTGRKKDGSTFPFEATIAKFGLGSELLLVFTMRDRSQIHQAEDELLRRSTHDSLTGLPNQGRVLDILSLALVQSRQRSTNVGVLLVDPDGFQKFNALHGHELGDRLLKELASRFSSRVASGDSIGRYFGDQFVIVCSNVTSPQSLANLAGELVRVASHPIQLRGSQTAVVTTCVGIALGQGTTHSTEDLLREAQTACKIVKGRGGNGWQFYDSELAEEAKLDLFITTGLNAKGIEQQLYVMAQPIVDAESGLIQGAELLLRWRSERGEISPARFIPIAENSAAIVNIGRWVFDQDCQTERLWFRLFGDQAPYLAVNVSTQQLSHPGFLKSFKETLDLHQADPTRLVIEVTETALMSDIEATRQILNDLGALGFRVAVDDFGTGYSSLAQLSRLRVDVHKVDREFVRNLDTSNVAQTIADAVCRLAKALSLKIVAEGVETATQRNTIRNMGADLIQGYFFHKPLRIPDFVQAVEKERAAQTQQAWGLEYVIYISRRTNSFTDSQILTALKTFRESNTINGISGQLLLLDGVFVQYFEGPAPAVNTLIDSIAVDSRHSEVLVLSRGALPKRRFSGWAMGFMDNMRLQAAFPTAPLGRTPTRGSKSIPI